MDIPETIQKKVTSVTKTIEATYSAGVKDGKSQKKNQSENEKVAIRMAESSAKRVDSNKNIPSQKKVKSIGKDLIDKQDRKTVLRYAQDLTVYGLSLPEEPKANPTPKSDQSKTSETKSEQPTPQNA